MINSVKIRDGISRTIGRFFTSSLARFMKELDPVQEEAMKENCLLVDKNDKVIGVASKRECHLVKKDGSLPLHRAFSVFLFNKNGDLLLQKRASTKVLFPGYYTSSTTGHPNPDIPKETEEADAVGVKLAALRNLKRELGFKNLLPSDLHYVTRLYYSCSADGKWGEHHITYVLIGRTECRKMMKPNPLEISEFSLVPKGALKEFLPTLKAPITPFFDSVAKHRLLLWWNNLEDLNSVTKHDYIDVMEGC